jgi:hypothetical protein
MSQRPSRPRCGVRSCRPRRADRLGSHQAGGAARCRCARSHGAGKHESRPSVRRDGPVVVAAATGGPVPVGTTCLLKQRPWRFAERAEGSVPVGRCRYSSEVTSSWITLTSVAVSCGGESRGQDCRSSRAHCCARFQAGYRDGDSRMSPSPERSGTTERDCSTARSSERLSLPSGSLAWFRENRETFNSRTSTAQQGGQLLSPSAQPKDFLLQPKGFHVEDIDGNDCGVWRGQPATRGRAWDASLHGAIDIACRPDKIPKAVIVTALRASCGRQASIIVTVARRATGHLENDRFGLLYWRKLAQKTPECRDTQHGLLSG